jgi:hypothetical protein
MPIRFDLNYEISGEACDDEEFFCKPPLKLPSLVKKSLSSQASNLLKAVEVRKTR